MNPGLTSFRAIAFMAVFLFHIGLLRSGYLGVQAFFVLSGFLLTPILIEMKKNLPTRDYFINFYGRRALRIFPLYYSYLICVTVISVLILGSVEFTGSGRLENFLDQLPWSSTFSYNFYHASKFFEHTHLVTHFWSLAVEEQFYLIWPLVLLIVPFTHLKVFLLLTLVMGPFIRAGIAYIVFDEMIEVVNQRIDMVVYVLSLSHIDAFATGGFFALYGKSTKGYYTWMALAFVIALGLITELISHGSIRSLSSLGYPPLLGDSYKYIWGYTVLNLLFAFLIIQVKERKFLVTLFENRSLVYLGKISYGLYVFHFPTIFIVYHLLPYKDVFIQGPVALICTIIIGALSYEFMESKCINLKDRFFNKYSDKFDTQIPDVPAVEFVQGYESAGKTRKT